MTKVHPEISKPGSSYFKSVRRESTHATELRNKLEGNVRLITESFSLERMKIDEH